MDLHLGDNAKTETSPCLPSVSLQLLKEHERKRKSSCWKKVLNEQNSDVKISISSSPSFSTQETIDMARTRLLQYASPDKNTDIFSVFTNAEECKFVELALLLQIAAFDFSVQKFDRAKMLLSMCDYLASPNGNSLQRLVFYFVEALRERIKREIGMLLLSSPTKESIPKKPKDVEEALTILTPTMLAYQEELPFCQVTQFTAVQAISENLGSSKRIHIVDFGIKSGSHWTIMMQALAARQECPIELLKITAVGTSKPRMEDIGKMLTSFAETMNIPFQFKLVVSEMENVHTDLFELEDNEEVAVFFDLRLWIMLAWPNHLEALITTIKILNPCVMVVVEFEAKMNRTPFFDRFNIALSIYAAMFDCFEDCMNKDSIHRVISEEVYLRELIQNVIIAEGEERIHRHESLLFWRAFFTKFGCVEIPLSISAMYQANLVTKRKAKWASSCTVKADGKGLMVGWKGTPIKSLSVWKFHQE